MLKFGTDGWSAVISEEFSFDNVKKLATALAVHLFKNGQLSQPVVVGYDARFLSEKAAETIVKVLEEAGASILLADRDLPLPVLEWVVKDHNAACGVMVTGSARPAQSSGLKVIPATLGPEIDRIMYYDRGSVAFKAAGQKIERFDPRDRYCAFLAAEVDASAINKAKLRIVVDPMFGPARGYLDTLLQSLGCEVEEIHNYRDVLFGGRAPDPREENLTDLKAKVAENKAELGFALSGDGADFAVVKAGGQFFSSAQFAGLQANGPLEACLRIVEQAARHLL